MGDASTSYIQYMVLLIPYALQCVCVRALTLSLYNSLSNLNITLNMEHICVILFNKDSCEEHFFPLPLKLSHFCID